MPEVKPGRYAFLPADATRLPFKDQSFDLVFGSPPYCDARTYGINAQRKCVDWVEWMLRVTLECQRVCRGPVVWVAAGVTRGRNYQPACEGLMWEWWKLGGECQLYRPCFWNRVGIPGSGGNDWFRADVEYVMCFKRPGALPWADNTAMGHPPKWGPGGEMSHRVKDGSRRNQWGGHANKRTSQRRKDGSFQGGSRPSHRLQRGNEKGSAYGRPALANPGNLIRTNAGGGHMGHALAHENEAPFPEKLPEFFVRSLCPPGGRVLDPFSGSGTTASVAVRLGRDAVGCDLRMSQCDLGRRRTEEQLAAATLPAPRPRRRRRKAAAGGYLFPEMG